MPQTVDKNVTIQVDSVVALVITSGPAIPDAVLNVPYYYQFTATGGTTPYTWSKVAGTLPAGLGPLTAQGVLQGVPTLAAGPVTIQVQVVDSGV